MMRRSCKPHALVPWLVAALAAGCGGVGAEPGEADPMDDTAPELDVPSEDDEVELPTELPAPVPWQAVGELSVDDFGRAGGEEGWISVPFPAGQRYVAVRTLPVDADPEAEARTCHRVLEARLRSGASLLPEPDAALLDEHQRFEPGPGAGVFVLSTAEAPLDRADTLELRVGLYDCELKIPASRARFPGMPHALTVDAAWEPAPTDTLPDATLAVRLARAEDSGWGTLADDPALAEAFAVAAERFADVGVELVVEAEATFPATGTLRYGADMLGLDALDAEVRARLQGSADDARFVPVVLVRCLEFDDPVAGSRLRPMGQASRIPGSMADARTPSLVVLAAGDCGDGSDPTPSLEPERHGLVLAHELGHYLGLLHADEPSGAHVAGDVGQRLMDSTIALEVDADEGWFSQAQALVLRRHPDVVIVL